MKMISAEQLQRLRETYPSGIRVDLIRMEDMQAPSAGYTGHCHRSGRHRESDGQLGQWQRSECHLRSGCCAKGGGRQCLKSSEKRYLPSETPA